MNLTLEAGKTVFKYCKRGLLVTTLGDHTDIMFYIPRSNSMTITTLGKNVSIKFGKNMKLTMPHVLWNTWKQAIIAAAMGEDVVS
jgi:hypothetical protein